MNSLSDKKCVPCEGGIAPMSSDKVKEYLGRLKEGWESYEDDTKIRKNFEFEDFEEALKFVNKVGEIAEEEGHHPNIYMHDYNKVKIELWTHKINGLHENDFVLASKIDDKSSNGN